MRTIASVALVLALAACGGNDGEANQADAGPAMNVPQEPQIAIRSAMQDELHRLTPQNRDIGLKRAILASGLRCKRVTGSGYVTEYNKLSMWTASCDDGRNWAIFAGADGSAQVRPCTEMRQFNLPPCVIAKDGSKPAVNWKPGDPRPEGL